tara:strand:- start:6213 stop:6932 length:720 start_codon:yes stop_codon:yes gene_type:complete
MLKHKLEETRDILLSVKNKETMRKPIILFSGGKDSIITAHVTGRYLGIRQGFSENSVLPSQTNLEIRRIAKNMGLNIVWNNGFSTQAFQDDWYNQIPPKHWVANMTDKQRHWKSMPRFAKKHNISMMIFGRRLEENRIKASSYYTTTYKKALQVHPIMNWTLDNLLEYKALHNLEFPSCYDDGSKHLLCITSIGQNIWKETGDIDKVFDYYMIDFPELVKAGANVDDRAKQYLIKNNIT